MIYVHKCARMLLITVDVLRPTDYLELDFDRSRLFSVGFVVT